MRFADFQDRDATVLVYLSPDCPLSQTYTRTLDDISQGFDSSRIAFFGVVAGTSFDSASVAAFAERYRLAFPILLDSDFKLATLLAASVTPEVFVVNSRGAVVYQGAIDNGAAALGTPRTVVTEHYLARALEAVAAGRTVPTAKTTAIGCYIERPN